MYLLDQFSSVHSIDPLGQQGDRREEPAEILFHATEECFFVVVVVVVVAFFSFFLSESFSRQYIFNSYSVKKVR